MRSERFSNSSQAGRLPAPPGHVGDPQRALFSTAHPLPVALYTQGVSALANGVNLCSPVAQERHAGKRDIRRCAKPRVVRWGERPPPAPQSAIASRCKRRKKGARGYDSGKNVKGRKRHTAVDTQGVVRGVVVHPANIQDRGGAIVLLSDLFQQLPRLRPFWVEARQGCKPVKWATKVFGWTAGRWRS